jgi:hypothetical protein
MRVYTESSNDGMALLFRRTGTTVCFLVGFGLLAVVMASNASADDRQPGDENPVQGTVESVTVLLSSLTSTAEPVLGPVSSVVDSGVGVLVPVVQPIVGVVEPITTAVLQPVVSIVTPVVGSAVTDPVGGPAPSAADSPVAIALETSPPQQMSQWSSRPAPPSGAATSPAAISEATRWPDSSHEDVGHASAAFAGPARLSGTGDSGDTPGVLVGPANALLGGGSAGSSGGSHGADAAVSAPGYPPGYYDSGGRSPPNSIGGQPWFGYDARDHPS